MRKHTDRDLARELERFAGRPIDDEDAVRAFRSDEHPKLRVDRLACGARPESLSSACPGPQCSTTTRSRRTSMKPPKTASTSSTPPRFTRNSPGPSVVKRGA